MLDAEFALIIYDGDSRRIYRRKRSNRHPSALLRLRRKRRYRLRQRSQKPRRACASRSCLFLPGTTTKDGEFIRYATYQSRDGIVTTILKPSAGTFAKSLSPAIEKRLVADAKVGFLLSGGLDSSLVCAVAARKARKSRSAHLPSAWRGDAIDLKYAKEVADYIGSEHTEVIMTRDAGALLAGRRYLHARHIRYNDHPREHGHVSALQVDP